MRASVSSSDETARTMTVAADARSADRDASRTRDRKARK
jgi:hypothetical protein